MEQLPNPDPRARGVGALSSLLLDVFKTDVRPNASWHRRSYDRGVRVIGALILIAILAGMGFVGPARRPSAGGASQTPRGARRGPQREECAMMGERAVGSEGRTRRSRRDSH